MGEIYHSWNGTVLTITSDSGTSSADLKGDDGCRGPQGPAGGSITDKTLTIDNLAADAKAVGERLAGAGIHLTASGSKIVLKDANDANDNELTLFGKSIVEDGAIVRPGANGLIEVYVANKATTKFPLVLSRTYPITAKSGENVQFSVRAAGEGLTYQWQYNNPTSSNAWYNSSSATVGYNTDTLTVGANNTRNGFKYRLKITDANGTLTTTAEMTLTLGDETTYQETVEAVAYEVATPEGLNGIQVSAGGNYIDENGQHWIADTIGDSQRVQRIGYIASYAGEVIPGEFLSSTGELATGVEVLYVLDEPITTALASNLLVHTHQPDTTILNGAGVGMSITYDADVKTYIDNKFTALENAIISLGGNV